MRHLFAAPCVLASIGPAHSQESASFLTGAEVSKALAGHTLRGSDWAEYYEPGGTIKGNTRLFGVRIYSGSWTIQFDRVCYDFEGTSYDTCSQLRVQGSKILRFDLSGSLKRAGVATRAEGNQLAVFE